MSNASQGERWIQREQALTEHVCRARGWVCVELSADLCGLLTLSLYENNAVSSRNSLESAQ